MKQLERECRSFSQYLIGRPPSDYLLGKYIEAHQQGRIPQPDGAFDSFLVRVAARGPWLARLADSYASRLFRYGSLRKKLVLVLGLLECSPGSFELLDRVESGGFAGTIARLAWRTAAYAAMLALSLVLFVPARLWMSVFGRSADRPKAPVVEA
jgi:hypothetical protein